MEITKNELKALVAAGAQLALEQAGVTSGQVSRRQALARWGKWFEMKANSGEIRPITMGDKRNCKQTYLVSDILAARSADMREARIQLERL